MYMAKKTNAGQIKVGWNMTELPGRKAIFTGAGAPVPPAPSPEEIAEDKKL